jgi:hypothetical protein
MNEFRRVMGATFSPIVEGVLPLRDENGDSQPAMRLTVSREFPNIELFEAQPGTALMPPAGTGLHHIGVYVDDLDAESARLEREGLPLLAAGVADGKSPVRWAYHRMADGTILELADRRTAALRRTLIAGGVPDSPMVHRVIPSPDIPAS